MTHWLSSWQVYPCWKFPCAPASSGADMTSLTFVGYHPGLELIGVSTVGANQALAKVTANALSVLDFAGLSHIGTALVLLYGCHAALCSQLPAHKQLGADVFAGQAKPLMRAVCTFCTSAADHSLPHVDKPADQHSSYPLQATSCPAIHGESGLDLLHGRRLAASKRRPLPGKAVLCMHERIRAYHDSR